MIKRRSVAAIFGMIGLLVASVSAVRADEEPFYFCAGTFAEEIQANAVIVLRMDMQRIPSDKRGNVHCSLPNTDETTLLRLVVSGRNKELQSSILRYRTELPVAGDMLPAEVVIAPTTFEAEAFLQRKFKNLKRICGSKVYDHGLIKIVSSDTPLCSRPVENYFGYDEHGSISKMYCNIKTEKCLVSIDYGGWYFMLNTERKAVLSRPLEVREAFTQEISSRIVLSFTPAECSGEHCGMLDRIITQK